MRTREEIINNPNIIVRNNDADGGNGWIKLGRSVADAAVVVWSWGGGWDHVSVSFSKRCPTWDEMCKVKDAFFRDDECCVEYHPAKKDYVNFWPYCLHIWKPQTEEIPKHPKLYV